MQVNVQTATSNEYDQMAVVARDPDQPMILDREKWEIIEATFARRSETVSGKAVDMQARSLADSQRDLHDRIASIVANLANNSRNRTGAQHLATDFKSHTGRVVQNIKVSITKKSDNEAVVAAELPVLSPESIEALSEALLDTPARLKANPKFVDDAIAAVVVAYVQAYSAVGPFFDPDSHGSMTLKLQRALARSEMFSLDRELEGTVARRSATLFAHLEELARKFISLERDSTALEFKLEQLSKNEEGLSTKVSDATKDIDDLDGKTAAAYQSLIESIGLRETDNLWKNEAQRAKREYYASFFVLVIILLAIPMAIAISSETIFSLLNTIEESAAKLAQNNQGVAATAAVFGRVLLLTIPLGFIIWAIKIGVRYNVRSMLLMDDANHRVAMLNTYLFLIKQNAATVQDRGAVLEALFRRTPGHGPDTVEAPNLTDLMKYGQQIDKA